MSRITYYRGIVAGLDCRTRAFELGARYQIDLQDLSKVRDYLQQTYNMGDEALHSFMVPKHGLTGVRKLPVLIGSYRREDLGKVKPKTNVPILDHQSYIDRQMHLLSLLGAGRPYVAAATYAKDAEWQLPSAHPLIDRYEVGERLVLGKPDVERFRRIQLAGEFEFEGSHVELAFGSYCASLSTKNLSLSFLSSMIALEALFNTGHAELTYRVSRSTCVLLGRTREESERIFAAVKKLYSLRSKVVHTGENKVTMQDLDELRRIVRRAIFEASQLQLDKKDLVQNLNRYGFGSSTRFRRTFGLKV